MTAGSGQERKSVRDSHGAGRYAPGGDATIRCAIVGFGRLAQRYYVPALRSFGQVEIVAVADPLASSQAAANAAFPGARICSDHRDLWGREPFDAILVAAPPSSHLAIWNEAARHRLPTFMEKPFVLCDELEHVERAPHSRRLLMPNFNRRFWPGYRKLRELCRDGSIGAVERAEFTLRVDIRPWISVTTHRLSSREGGALYDLGSAQLDLIQYVFNQKIVAVRAQTNGLRGPADQVRLQVQLHGGLRVSRQVCYAGRNRERIVIAGDKATAMLDDPNARVQVIGRRSRNNRLTAWLSDNLTIGYRALSRKRSMLRSTVRASLAGFFDAIAQGRPFSPGFEDAVENALCLEAAMRSISEESIAYVYQHQA